MQHLSTNLSAGSEAPAAGFTWDITRSNHTLATNAAPNGWSASYDTTGLAFTVGAPFSAAVATGYKVRLSTGGHAYSALFDVVPASAGVPGNPAPPWAEDVRPTFSSPSAAVGSGHGPSA